MNGKGSYTAIAFDLDGTLVDSFAALTDAMNHALRAFDHRALSEEQIKEYVGEGLEVLLERCFAPAPVPEEARALFEGRYDAVCCAQSRLLDDVEGTLGALAARGVRMSVCTNKPTGFSAKILEHLGIASHFDVVAGPDLAGARKPDAGHVRYVLDRMRATPSETLFVGDMPIDVLAARNAGLDVAVIASGSSSLEILRGARPDFLLARFSDLLEIVGAEASAARR